MLVEKDILRMEEDTLVSDIEESATRNRKSKLACITCPDCHSEVCCCFKSLPSSEVVTELHHQKKRPAVDEIQEVCTASGEHDFDEDEYNLPHEIRLIASRIILQADTFVRQVFKGWRNVAHHSLPAWLKDNDMLLYGHRPQLNSFCACFKSVFRIHTETGNIWTHLLGCIAFFGVATYFLSRPTIEVQWQEKFVFSFFFFGAIVCLGFSTLFHTVSCHSERVGCFFVKLDYCGIALLTMGSFVPWLYYSFYCRIHARIVYLCLIIILGILAIVVSMWNKFAAPKYRSLRAAVFIALGLSGLIPTVHYVILEGFWEAVYFASLGWLMLMAVLYIGGALIYAFRFPERFFPGKFDIWFQSHQIFHVFVVIAAFVHYYGIAVIADYRLTNGACLTY